MQVYLPKERVPQKLSREELEVYNEVIKDKVTELYNSNKEEFVIQDGPPYANGELHLGHLLNKSIKDFVVKSNLIRGKKVKFKFGWDCHGLPIENKAKVLEGNLLTNARAVAERYSNIQLNTLHKFGIYQTNGVYKTMYNDFVDRELDLVNTLIDKGLILRKLKPTWYSPSLGTVLANSEIEYKSVTDKSVYFTFDTLCGKKLLVWTTTEWTIPGNQAVCLNKNIQYVISTYEDKSYICSKSYADQVGFKYELFDINTLTTYTNHKGEVCPVLFDDYVTDTNTGIVHLVGGHGDDDYEILMKNNITPRNVVDNYLLDVHIERYRMSDKYLVYREDFTHDYPFDWREGKRVYKTLIEQTYLDFDLPKIKELLKEIKMSSKDRARLSTTIFSRNDWCISRQRNWGVKIPNSNDILDVWFDSGSVFLMNDKPADVYIEGSDQHRGWFQSSIILASTLGRIPTKRIISHGFILDETKEKLSKSKGNASTLDEMYDTYNPDVLRLWVLMSDWRNDVVLSEESIKTAGKQYFRIRNLVRYLLNNLYLDESSYDYNKLSDEMKTRLKFNLNEQVDNVDTNKYIRDLMSYMMDYSSTLTEDIKNEFYESSLDSEFRYRIENEFYWMYKHLLDLIFPVCPFLYGELCAS